jgi:orotidine-5'-phosphate decarboxylase
MPIGAAERIICAIDTHDQAVAESLGGRVGGRVGGLKLGLEFFLAHGGLRSVLTLRPWFLTLHAAGGGEMMRRAAEAAKAAADGEARTRLLGVTVLTSLGDADLAATGQSRPVLDQVLRLARLARESGLDGVIASPHEVAAVRAECGPDFLIVTPGVRPAWSAMDDQKRVMSPAEAVAAGADYLVIGRPITRADDPRAAVHRIVEEIEAVH